jgi:hypothetical protein
MEAWIPIVISLAGSVVAIAVAWGRSSAEMEENKRWRAEMENKIKDCPTKENCALKHGFIEQTMREVKSELSEIKNMIMRVLEGK